jgi:hypothetical protein
MEMERRERRGGILFSVHGEEHRETFFGLWRLLCCIMILEGHNFFSLEQDPKPHLGGNEIPEAKSGLFLPGTYLEAYR